MGQKICWVGLATTMALNRLAPDISGAGVIIMVVGILFFITEKDRG